PKCLGGNLGDFGEFCKGLYIVGFVSSYSLSKSKKNALTDIAFLRGIDVYDPPISKEKALKALEKHPEIYQRFQHFFPFVELPLL
ncbi:TPA: hypothetical protein ACFMWN_000405, partial [Neisseria meningitidis]